MKALSAWQKYQLNKLKNKKPAAPAYCGYQHLKSVLLLCDFKHAEDEHIQNFLSKLNRDGKQVDTLRFFSRKRKELPVEEQENKHIFCRDDVNWFGKPKTDVVKSFASKPYDLLIDVVENQTTGYTFVSASMSASLIFGGKHNKYLEPIVLIKQTKALNTQLFFNEVIHYLNLINNTK